MEGNVLASQNPAVPNVAVNGPIPAPARASGGGQAPLVYVRGFWSRGLAALVDLSIITPLALVLGWLAGKLAGVGLPPMNIGLLDIDLWLDLVLAADPGLVMGLVLFCAIGLSYLTLFTILRGQTLGMKVIKARLIDAYGDSPSPRQCLTRVAGTIVGVATLGLGFLWIAFDSEKRGLQDWLAGTYVVRT